MSNIPNKVKEAAIVDRGDCSRWKSHLFLSLYLTDCLFHFKQQIQHSTSWWERDSLGSYCKVTTPTIQNYQVGLDILAPGYFKMALVSV